MIIVIKWNFNYPFNCFLNNAIGHWKMHLRLIFSVSLKVSLQKVKLFLLSFRNGEFVKK